MLLRSSNNLHYPITVTELLKQPGDLIERGAPIFSYFYKSTVTEGDKYGDEHEVEKTFPTRFESATDGTITRWCISQDSVLDRSGIELVEIDEPCRHDVQFGGLCANCGKDMTESDYNMSIPDTTRANINMSHGYTALRVSQEEAARVEQEAKRRLLKSRKLSLVVDLDQTIIHATVDPTVAEWQSDPSNSNYDAVKDVKSFQLLEDGPGRGNWYYIKLRPGLTQFLESVAKLYELHIYTMGTRAYAMNIAKIVDPDRKIFGDRILSRDESGSLIAKNLQRLFPVDTKMVVIIDDRGDVWNWTDNLIKVRPYDFFVGIGDINSSFLPRREVLPPPETPAAPLPDLEQAAVAEQSAGDEGASPSTTTSTVNGTATVPTNGESSTLDQLVLMGGANDAASIQQKTAEQDETIAAQVADRPLLQRQKALDRADDEALGQSLRGGLNGDTVEENGTSTEPPRHNLLHDDDNELKHLENSLSNVHRKFYASYERSLAGAKGGRIAQLRGEKSPKKRPDEELHVVPDVKEIMPSMKHKVLENCVLTFSGVIPLGIYAKHSDLGRWATSFGASINTDVHKNTTHVIAARNRRTAKVRVAARNPRIKIVTTAWLLDSMSAWKRLDETPYIIEVEPDSNHQSMAGSLSPFDEVADGALSSSEEEVNASEDNDSGTEIDTDNTLLNLKTNTNGAGVDSDEPPISPVDAVTDDDWKAMMAEIDDVSDTEDDESETDGEDYQSDGSQDSNASASGTKKRKRGATSRDSTDGEESDAGLTGEGSKLQRRKKRALGRTTSLTKVETLKNAAFAPHSSALSAGATDQNNAATAGGVGGADGAGDAEEQGEDGEEDDDDGFGADFEAELEAELIRGDEEDADTGQAAPLPIPAEESEAEVHVNIT